MLVDYLRDILCARRPYEITDAPENVAAKKKLLDGYDWARILRGKEQDRSDLEKLPLTEILYRKAINDVADALATPGAKRGVRRIPLVGPILEQIADIADRTGPRRKAVRQALETFASGIRSAKYDRSVKKRRIAVLGETYVRENSYANMNVVQSIEKLGLEAVPGWMVHFARGQKDRGCRRGSPI